MVVELVVSHIRMHETLFGRDEGAFLSKFCNLISTAQEDDSVVYIQRIIPTEKR